MKTAAWLTVIAFAAWLLPLGNFIRPSQEKTACGGNRAFHMCSMMVKIRSAGEKVSLASTGGIEKTQKAQASSAPSFLSTSDVSLSDDGVSRLLFSGNLFVPQTFFFSPEPVPKI